MLKARLTKVNVLNVKKTKNIRKFASKPAAKKEDKVEKNATVPQQQQQQTENFDVNSEIFGKIARGVQGVEIPSNLKKGIQTPKQLGLLLQSFATHGPNHLFQNNNIVQGPVRVAVTGAAGQIGYSLLPRIASGEMLGENQPVILHLIERPEAMEQLKGVVMELQDCAFPNLHGIVATSSLEEGFGDVDYAILVGAKPRGPGMERGDLLKDNAKIFTAQGSAIGNFAKSDALVLVVGNPANTNALIAASKASKRIPRENFSALTRLDHDRALAQIAIKTGCKLDDIERFAIWGNHSATQYPDLSFTTIDGKWAKSIINDEEWIRSNFIPTVQKRGAAIIAARGASSAQSAADASIKHMRDWVFGAPGWLSMAVPSDGSYGIPEGVFCSYPVQCFGQGKYGIIGNLPIDEFSAKMINQSVDELFSERDAVKELIQ